MKIKSFSELRQKISEAEAQRQVSDDAFRQALAGWYLSAELFGNPPADPFSDEFKAFQLEAYQQLTKKNYETANESTDFDFEHELKWPYPYGTQSSNTVGGHLMGYGWLIEKMNLTPQAKVLEIGSGFGALTVHLAQMGYRVTCLDISQPLLDYVQTRTIDFPQPIETICGDMASVPIEGVFDAVIFNASFHHSLEHRQVIERLKDVVAPTGQLVFVSEPILGRFSSAVPHAWGLRLDGLSVLSIVQWGWLELGFQTSYFTKLLKNCGWRLKRHDLGLSAGTDVWVATRQNGRQSALATFQLWLFGYEFDLETGAIRLVKKISRGVSFIRNLIS